jgi:RNA polymerase sigma factor (sigma-70 family)
MSRLAKSTAADVADGQPASLVKSRVDELLPLARAAARGDEEAAGTLVAHVGRSMLAVVRRVLGREHADVDDVTQDAVLALLDGLGTFRAECTVLHFAQRIALLTALTAQRRLRLRARWAPARTGDEHLADKSAPSPVESAAAGHRRAVLRDLLAELPDIIGEALALHYMLDYTVEEIAAAAGVSPNTVWSRLRLGKQALRRKLDANARLAERLEVGE